MAQWRLERTVDLFASKADVEALGLLAYTTDAQAHRIELTVMRGQEVLSFDDMSVKACFFNIQGDHMEELPHAGMVEGGKAVVIFPARAYRYGKNIVVIKLESPGISVTIYAATFRVQNASPDALMDSDNVVPNLPELLAQIDAMKVATTAANNAAKNAGEISTVLQKKLENGEFIGPRGEPGRDGTVSFDELTDAQRESLRGPEGRQGEPGLDGKDGIQPIRAGESVSLVNAVFSSYITTAGTHLYIYVPISRPIEATGVAVNSISFMLRLNGGYLLDSGKTRFTMSSVSEVNVVSINSDSGVCIYFACDGGFGNDSNNRSIGCYGDISLTFTDGGENA